MNKDRIPNGGKGYLDVGFLAQQRKQREANFRRQHPILSSPKKRVVQEIEVLGFQGIPDLRPINLNDYYDLPGLVRQVLQPGKSVDYAVCCLMVHMLEALPNGFFGPKRSYVYPEKQYAVRQIRHLSDSLSALEVCLDHYNNPSSELKGFRNKENYHFRSLADFMASPAWTGDSKYHIVYLKSPGAFANNYDKNKFASEFVQAKYGEEIHSLEAYMNQHSAEAESLENDLDPFISQRMEEAGITKESDPDLIMSAVGKAFTSYIETHTDLSDIQRELLNKTVRLVELYNLSKAEMLKIPDEIGVIKGIASRLHNFGILIVAKSEVEEDIPGMTFIGYQKGTSFAHVGVSLYQRREL